MPDISKLSGTLIDSVGKVDGVLKGDIASIVGLTIPSGTAYTPPLDVYTGATAAYSVRKLSSSYSGSCIEAYRVSDGATQDIGFDGDGLIDTAAIIAFGGGSVVGVRTWYDQSGNGLDGVQSTSANQPIIYDGSALIEDNGIAAIRFKNQDNTGVNRWFDAGDNGDTTGDISVFSVLNHRNSTLSQQYGGPVTKSKFAAGASRWAIQPTQLVYVDSANAQSNIANQTSQNTQILFTGIALGGNSVTMYENTIAEPNTGSPSGSAGDNSQHLLIGAYGDSSGLGGAQDSMRGVMQEVIYYASDRSSNLLDLNLNLNSYYQIANLPAQTGFLADYPDAAAAYSVRSLSNNAIKCMRVRRTVSPFDEQDIGFDSNGDLDTAAIAAFGGSDSLTVSAWYDQSGNNKVATQATATNQPKIYDGAAVITKNGKPALETDGVSDYLTFTSTTFSSDFCFVNVQTFSSGVPFGDAGYGGPSGNFCAYGLNATTIRWRLAGSTSDFTIPTETNGTQYLAFANRASGSINLHYQGVDEGSSANTGTATLSQIMAGNATGGLLLDGHSQELILWPSDQSSNRTGIESDINTYYSIY